MPHETTLFAFAAVALAMVLTPGPNMIYLISRSITQGAAAGLISLAGVALGFVFYMLCTAFGITALVFAVPYAYDALRFAGAAYLLWLAWQALKPGGRSPFQVERIANRQPAAAFCDGPSHQPAQSEDRDALPCTVAATSSIRRRACCAQSVVLGGVQIAISITVNSMIALAAGSIAAFLSTRPKWLLAQRWVMGTVLGGLAVRLALESRK